MACLRVLVVTVLALRSAQLSWGDIIELEKFRAERDNYFDLVFDHNRPTTAKHDATASKLDSHHSVRDTLT